MRLFIFYYYILLLHLVIASCYRNAIMDYLIPNKTRQWYMNLADQKNSYCRICCMDFLEHHVNKICGKHTMCLYETDKPGPSCKGFIRVDFTQEEMDAIVDVHNRIRNYVSLGSAKMENGENQPKASNMRKMEWDEELAKLALRWASQCVFTYDRCRDVPRFPVGQNIAVGNSALNDDISYVLMWYEDGRCFSGSINNYNLT